MKKNNRKKSIYPYIVHCDPLWDEGPLYPTHTHGLTKIGLPEFIFDPLAFGPEGNCSRINGAYRYFLRPENAHLLDKILKGEIVKISGAELSSNAEEPNLYCFREVSPDFEAVKLAYGPDVRKEYPGMKVIQIWVDGDYFALTNEYYIGGVIW